MPKTGTPRMRRLLQHRHFGVHLLGHLGPVHAPLAAEQQHEVVTIERWPVARRLAMALVERVPVFTEAFADEAGIGVGRVGDEQSTHW